MSDIGLPPEGSKVSASALIGRLSFWLVGGATVLMVSAVTLQLLDTLESRELVIENDSSEIFVGMHWGGVALVALVWTFLICTFWCLGKLREWARKTTIGIFSILSLSFVWNGCMALLMSVALIQVDFSEALRHEWSARLVIALFGLILLIVAWWCWRLVRFLRTEVVRGVFQK